MSKKAICTGIDNYPGTANDLKGCVNDANNWAKILTGLGFETKVLENSQVTKQNILSNLYEMVLDAKAGDVLVFTYSGHGTQVSDYGGDEPDGYDEALYVYDGVLSDDLLREAIIGLDKEVAFTFISDSCFSGTVTRVIPKGEKGKAKFIKPKKVKTKRIKQLLKYEEDMQEVLLSGCSDTEYSYDALIDGEWGGAFTHYATKAYALLTNPTYTQLHDKIREYLPSDRLPQTPQLEGSKANLELVVFEGKPKPPPPPPPTVEPNWFIKLLIAIYEWIVNLFK